MKKSLVLILLIFTGLGVFAQGVYTRQYDNSRLTKKAQKWLQREQWRCGFDKAVPDSTVNVTEFYLQYQRNPEQWEALFRWLAQTDLLTIEKGKHPIDGTTLVASVEDSKNSPLEKRQSESHYHHIDFQYVVKGVERFGLIDHTTSTPNCEWREDVIHYDYDVAKTRFVDSSPDRFFIFFPDDWHIAKVDNGTSDQQIRVIVIKVDYVE